MPDEMTAAERGASGENEWAVRICGDCLKLEPQQRVLTDSCEHKNTHVVVLVPKANLEQSRERERALREALDTAAEALESASEVAPEREARLAMRGDAITARRAALAGQTEQAEDGS